MAIGVVEAEWVERISGILDSYAEKYGASELERVQECFMTAIGQKNGKIPHAEQRSKIYFPGLTDNPWPEPGGIEAISILEEKWEVITGELLSVLKLKNGFQPYMVEGNARHANDWNVYYFKNQKLRFEDNRANCPETAKIIESLPRLGETAMFSALNPKCRVTPHFGTWNVRLTVHLGLVIPQPCAIEVGGQTQTWQEGKCIVFDDSYRHEAWNDSDRTRFVLLLDVWHPKLTSTEIHVLEEIAHVVSTEEQKAAQIIERNRKILMDQVWWV